MALHKFVITLACAVAFPVGALAQVPAWTLATDNDCCSAEEGSAVAAAVLLPPVLVLPAEEAGAALAAAVLIPPADPAMAGMACCNHEAPTAQPAADDGCCTGMKDGCGMPCCRAMPPTR